MFLLYIKAFHIISVIAWMAGILYLPRLFVYHAMSDDRISIDRFKIMERKLYYGITMPGGVATLALGIWMLIDYGWAAYGDTLWLQIKLGLIALLVIYHLYCGKLVADFKHERNQRDHVWFRWFNELPVVLLIAIVLLAVVKPV